MTTGRSEQWSGVIQEEVSRVTSGSRYYGGNEKGGVLMAEMVQMSGQAARRVVASFVTYTEAQRAVDYLSDRRFPVERVAIVAEGLRFVEQVTGRLTWGKAALNGALGGAGTGLLLGALFGLFSLVTPLVSVLVLAVYGLLLGVILGVIMGLLFYALSGGQRDFMSLSTLQAERYTVAVAQEMADEAARLLAGMHPA
jgi:hypothetical protein